MRSPTSGARARSTSSRCSAICIATARAEERSGLRESDEVARRVAEGAVAGAPGLRRRLLQHLGTRGAHLLERRVQVVGLEDGGLQRTLDDQRQQGVALGL